MKLKGGAKMRRLFSCCENLHNTRCSITFFPDYYILYSQLNG